jgi:SAM-dependent methyltransferase
MDRRDIDRIVSRYNARLREFGDDIRTLASGSEERRAIRFATLTDVGVESGCSVVDLGCGFGDYFRFLQERDIAVDYTGVDINPELVEIARAKWPGARFDVRDAQIDGLPECDFVVSTSAFNLPLEHQDNYDFVADILRAAFAAARKGVAVDFLSTYVDYRSPHGFHYSPERIFAAAKGITRRVMLRHDYPLFEFCVYLYPDFDGWRPTA